jgi:tetratricopeptide (TPR) repeat protein
MSLILAMLAQIGPFATTGAPEPLRPPAGGRHGAAAPAAPAAPAPAQRSRLEYCLDAASNTPVDAIDDAETWRDAVQGSALAEPNLCLGSAHARLEHWDEAEAAFLIGRDMAAENDRQMRAKLGAMAGNAALAQGAWERALAPLDMALADAKTAGDLKLTGEVQIDRARALVALKREAEASDALVEARTSAADNGLAWLLSATLSRRQGKLAAAQAQIATAAELAPRDPEVGLEAGVIAMLAGNEAAARKSWQSAIATAPASEAAATAKGYLAQLDATPQSKP